MKKRMNYPVYPLMIAIVIAVSLCGCEKDEDESLPTLVTMPVTYISETSVVAEGCVTDDGGAGITERGICWATSPNPTTANDKTYSGSGIGCYTCSLTGLATNTEYYVRAFAGNRLGTAYGPQIRFRTWNDEFVTDIDGNTYHTVTIGAQVWLVENLMVTHYRNGEGIDCITDNAAWEGLTSGAYCDYEDYLVNVEMYGRLYNWFAVNDFRNIAPDGWHAALDEEWIILTEYLGGEAIAGAKLKEAGLEHWIEPNSGATNETGFSGLPGGYRNYGGGYEYINWGGGWWTASEENSNDAWIRYMDYGDINVWRYLEDKRYGRSVRCVKD